MTKAIPDGYQSITPAMTFKDTLKAIEFYKKAFGAKECMVLPNQNGKGTMWAQIQIGSSLVMMGDEIPKHHRMSAETLGSTPIAFYFYVDDVDGAFKKAIKAGAVSIMEPHDTFYGDRMGSLKDPFGYYWSIASRVRELSPDEMKANFAKLCATS